jgi:short-subunit dehydrogenase
VDIGRYPPEMVMTPEDLVDASLAGLAKGEVVCIPSLPNLNDWESLERARGALAALVSSDRPAVRYAPD